MKVSRPTFYSIGGAFAALLALVATPARPEVLPSAKATSSLPSASGTLMDPAQSPGHQLWRDQLERAESLPWGKDPFLPAFVAPDVSEPTLEPLRRVPRSRLTGISLKDGVYLAIIDRRIVRAGDALPSGYFVKNIDHTAVVIQRGDHEFTLTLGDQE